jgi:peptide chain release factor 3
MPAAALTAQARADAAAEAARRRTFAIISHPDAGKTTLTEKLLLYAGAVAEAGAVKARRSRRAVVSDWMELERERGISVSSTVLRFSFADLVFNLLDTPGHRDFSEDTLRVLVAADAAVILIDAARGIQEQTFKLFEIARERGIPLLTFINKYDRPGREPLELIDEIEQRLELTPAPLTWPVGPAGDFRGVVDRRDGRFHRFARTPGGATIAQSEAVPASRARSEEGDAWAAAEEELALLDAVGARFDTDAFSEAVLTPVFFGSTLSNFGVDLLLHALAKLAPPPRPRVASDGEERDLGAPFSGLVFKVQANLDPRHRDRLAYVRVCSGRFERGMRLVNARSSRAFSANYAHSMFGQERDTIETAFAGDVVRLTGAGDLRVGDTVYVDEAVEFPPLPTLTPEHFAYARNHDTARYKQFRRGLAQLDEEGVVHVLRDRRLGDQAPVLAGAGPMQFDVALHRLRHEFGADVGLEAAPWRVARRTDEAGEQAVGAARYGALLIRADGTRLALFENEFQVDRFERDRPDVTLDRFLVHASVEGG